MKTFIVLICTLSATGLGIDTRVTPRDPEYGPPYYRPSGPPSSTAVRIDGIADIPYVPTYTNRGHTNPNYPMTPSAPVTRIS